MPLSTVMNTHRMASYALFSALLVGLVVVNGFRKHSNFYSIAVYLSKSNGSVLALANFGLFLTLMAGRACQRVFFGPLRPVEVERLYDRMWFFVTESLLAFTIFRDEFDAPFVFMFVLLLFLKCFHWILADRIDWMDQVPFPGPGALFHARTVALLFTLWIIDLVLTAIAIESLLSHGVGWIILFASEYGILLASLMNAWLKYVIAAYDLRRASTRGGENAPLWEDRSMYIFYVELLTDFFKLSIYLVFFGAVMTFYGLPLNVVRDVYITARSFVTRVQDLIRYRSATKNMDQKYPNATREELHVTSDRTCIICREEMIPLEPNNTMQPRDGPNDTPKKLPCGHIFHFHCLRSWLERQQSCPTCRRSVLETTPPTPNNNNAPANAAAPAPAAPLPGAAPVPPVPGATPAPPRPTTEADRDRDLIAETDALLERLGLRQPGEGGGRNHQGARDTATPQPSGRTPVPRLSGNAGAMDPPLPPMQFEGFSVGGVWQPWTHAPTPTPTTAVPPTLTVPTTGTSVESGVEPKVEELATSAATNSSTDNAPTSTLTPKEAAAAAALRRFGGTPAPSPSSTPVAASSTSTTSLASSSRAGPSSTASSSHASTIPALKAPKLIPLFDPSAISTQLSQRLPSPFSTPFAGFPFASPSPMSGNNSWPTLQSPSITMSASSPISQGLTDSQLQKMDRLTREGIEERLKVLDGVQTNLWKCVEDLTRMKSVLPPLPATGDDSDGRKGKERA
ncbi:E3 ubiquitin-protein ligase hrd1 [Tulasnella sp. JGI-2019a]|nr:E3 ubiquitin-protein ligase hrd1 [Tulasnella sp. JGI-2019a]